MCVFAGDDVSDKTGRSKKRTLLRRVTVFDEEDAMRNLGAVLCLSVLAFACGGGHTLPTAPSDSALTALTPTNAPRVITVGEEIRSTLTGHGTGMLFELTAPADGTLIVRVDWNPTQGRLQLVDRTRQL